MPNEKILLKAEANRLGIPEYRKMGLDELKTAIAKAKTGTKGKGKVTADETATNGDKGKAAATTVVKGKPTITPSPPKGKTTTTPAKGKSTSRKTTAKKPSAAPGKAKRVAAPKRKTTTKAKGKKTTTAKAPRTAKALPARVDIDRTQIDWRVESNVGNRGGKREEVMAELRKRKGNYDKVFDALIHRAKAFYPGKTKHEAELMLRWLINRVAFDYVKSTDQHTSGERAKYGKSKAAQDIRRRELREEARKEREKAERAAKRKKSAKKR